MSIERLGADRVAELRASELTYPEAGQTAGTLPQGYRLLHRTAQLPESVDFETVAGDLLHWRMHRRAGLRVRASTDHVTPDAVVVLSIGVGPLAVPAPCRVVYVVNEPRRRGFAYGTLPGHPECGEEAFLLEKHADDSVTFTITAFSRPACTLARMMGPIGTAIQDFVTGRYLRAAAR